MSPRTGRPPSGNARKKKVETRMSKEELEKLDYCCEKIQMSRSEVIRAGIDGIYTSLRKLEKNDRDGALPRKKHAAPTLPANAKRLCGVNMIAYAAFLFKRSRNRQRKDETRCQVF